ncbi:MAG: methyl-accepting chemotaxis protein [Firmicutes bacterium]|nr:methyl-accepting chemotaxis protein [Bacillota bacterium]
MGWFTNSKTRSKLVFGFGLILVLLGVVTIVAYQGMTDLNRSQTNMFELDFQKSFKMTQIRSHMNHQRADMLELVYSSDKALHEARKKEILQREEEVNTLMNEIEELARRGTDLEEQTIIGQIRQTIAEFRDGRLQIISMIEQGKLDEARLFSLGEQVDRTDKVRNKVMEAISLLEKRTTATVRQSQQSVRDNLRLFGIVAALALLLAFVLVWFLNRLIAVPLGQTVQMIQEMSLGNLNTRLKMDRTDEVGLLAASMDQLADTFQSMVLEADKLVKAAVAGQLSTRGEAGRFEGVYRDIVSGVNDTLDAVIGPLTVAANHVDRIARDEIPRPITETFNGDFNLLKINLNKMTDNLRNLNRELQGGFGVLASSSTEILATVSQVAAGATETATAVSETSTTAEEVKQTAHLSNQKARMVQESAQKASIVSEAGRKAVADTLDGMNRIHEQMDTIAQSVVRLSEQGQTIGEIIATVNDLSEQSNLLADNAAIEATRAGEYGRGFAVVAQEVRSLAEQSRQATAQVRSILMEVQKATSAAVMSTEQGTKAVAAGVRQATEAGESIRALTVSVAEAAQAATQIAASSQQQLVGMDQITSAVANIRQATIQNVAGTRQLETSAQSLQELGGRLKTLVERQRLES